MNFCTVCDSNTADRGSELRLAAQGTTGTILGTVTDSTGGAIPMPACR